MWICSGNKAAESTVTLTLGSTVWKFCTSCEKWDHPILLKKDNHLGQSMISGHTPVRLKGLICHIRSSAGKTEGGVVLQGEFGEPFDNYFLRERKK